MAPGKKHTNRNGESTGYRPNNSKVQRSEHKNKRKWVSEHNQTHGSLHEGQGFALKRKEKVKHEYRKLLRRQWKSKGQKSELKSEYPDHLQHLYLAEEQRERNEQRKRQRSTERIAPPPRKEESSQKDEAPAAGVRMNAVPQPQPTDCSSGQTKELCTQATPASSPQQDRKTGKKTTSYNRTKEQYKKQQEERKEKKEAYLKYTADREQAVQMYKEKKMATYNLLKRKTKKGQPNLNAQMELLLQKIQQSKQ